MIRPRHRVFLQGTMTVSLVLNGRNLYLATQPICFWPTSVQ